MSDEEKDRDAIDASGVDTQKILEMIDYYNDITTGRKFNEVVPDITDYAAALGSIKLFETELEQHGLTLTLVRAMSFGIFLAELGKTKFLGEKVLQ